MEKRKYQKRVKIKLSAADQPFETKFDLEQMKNVLNKLEGVSEALKPFHPRLGTYIESCINEIRRMIHALEMPNRAKEWLGLGSASKMPAVDAEVEEEYRASKVKAKIAERKIMEGRS